MITLKSSHEIELMRRAGKITAAARALAGEMVRPGVTTQEIDSEVERFIRKNGAVPSFLHYNGYPASACISGVTLSSSSAASSTNSGTISRQPSCSSRKHAGSLTNRPNR